MAKNNLLRNDFENDGVDRRGFLKCMQWAGTAVVWSFAGGVPVSRLLAADTKKKPRAEDFTFVQISDSHIGFNKPANPDVARHASDGNRQHQHSRAGPRFPDPHGGPHAPCPRERIRRSRTGLDGIASKASFLCAGRARRHRGRRETVPRTIWQEHVRKGLVQLQPQGGPPRRTE